MVLRGGALLRLLMMQILVLSGCGKVDGLLESTLNPLALPEAANPSSGVMVGDVVTLQPSGGAPPYSYRVVSGEGIVDGSTGQLMAPSNEGTVTVEVTDSRGRVVNYSVAVNPPLNFVVSDPRIAVNNDYTFSASGGVGEKKFSLLSGGGVMNPMSGLYEPHGYVGVAKVQVQDSAGHSAENSITVNPPLAMSPASHNMWTLTTQVFTGTGGVPPYVFSVVVGDGSIGFSDGLYQASATSGHSILSVTDSLGNTASASVSILQGVILSPTVGVLAPTNQMTFTAQGGESPYSFSIVSGPGVLTGYGVAIVTATAPGNIIVQVTDAVGNISQSQIVVNQVLQMNSSSPVLAVNNSFQFSATGGVGTYTYFATTGIIDSDTGSYVAPSSAGSDTVTVRDSLGNISQAHVTISPALQINPQGKTLAVNNTLTFTASAGVGPYSFSASVGTINSNTGVYTAPATGGVATVTVTDSLGNISQATVTVNPALSASVDRSVIAANNSATISGSGGVSPYSYTKVSGPGFVNSTSGVYTPGVSGTAVLQVADSLGNTANVNVTVNGLLSISPGAPTVVLNASQTFTATGGVSPYSYSLPSGSGSVNSSTGVYTAPGTVGSASVRVTDALGNISLASVNIVDCVPGSQVFAYTGAAQTFTQKTGCTKVSIKVWGAGGGSGLYQGYSNPGGAGGYAGGDFNLPPGSQLQVNVGGAGIAGVSGGWNGGGAGDPYYVGNYGSGGGASDVRFGGTALSDRIIVAGGGGGGPGGDCGPAGGCPGGFGGGLQGGAGVEIAGTTSAGGGTQSAGGAGAYGYIMAPCYGNQGTLGKGGNAPSNSGLCGGSGGGGGYYGGGSGAVGGSGGGGSSYIANFINGGIISGSGSTPGNSLDSDCVGAGTGGVGGGAGAHGRIVIYYSF